MSMQDLFYLMGIIFMISGTMLVLTITIVLVLVYRRMAEVKKFFVNYVQHVISNIFHPKEAAMAIGRHAARTAIKRIREVF